MKKSEVMRLYNFSDGHLVTKAKEKIAFIKRDKEQFLDFGITSPMLVALESAIKAFSNMITDIEARSDKSGVTDEKDLKAEEIRVAIRNMMSRVALVYNARDAKYKKFGTDELSGQRDADLLFTGKRVARVAKEFLAQLSGHGVTQMLIDTIIDLCDEFEDLIIDAKIKTGERDIMQEDRVEAGNAIYLTLVSYTNTGKNIWETSDVAKYNDYLIYNTDTGEVVKEVEPKP